MSTQLMIPGIIDRKAENEIISQRATDGYINATAMCKAAGKNWSDYIRLESTKAFINELSSALHIPQGGLVQSIVGGTPHLQGTWIHPQLSTHLAQWLSPKFAVLVSGWIMDWMTGNTKSAMPYHLRRYLANQHKVPYGYFSMLNEVVLNFIGNLESFGYIPRAQDVPDISVGKMFSGYLRDNGYPVSEYPYYKHSYEDGRMVDARAYPIELLPVFKRYFFEVWMRYRARNYLAERDPSALPYFDQFVALPNYREVMGYLESNGESRI